MTIVNGKPMTGVTHFAEAQGKEGCYLISGYETKEDPGVSFWEVGLWDSRSKTTPLPTLPLPVRLSGELAVRLGTPPRRTPKKRLKSIT